MAKIPSQTYDLELDLTDVPSDKISQVKDEVGKFVVESILTELEQGQSPVKGEKFKKLSKAYADKEKGGDRTPNLELTGAMRKALDYKSTKSGIKIGILDSTQAPKADGHNNFSGQSKLPTRRFIPSENQTFKKDIVKEINFIVDSYRETPVTITENQPRSGISISLNNILSEQNIVNLLFQRLK